MKVLGDIDCNSWLLSKGYKFKEARVPLGSDGVVYLPEEGFHYQMETPEDAWVLLMTSYQLINWISQPDVLLWITSWATYKEEEMEIFLDFRSHYGEYRHLIDAPGHLLNTENKQEFWIGQQMLLFMLAFGWEGFILQSDRTSVVWIADGILEVFTDSKQKQDEYLFMAQHPPYVLS